MERVMRGMEESKWSQIVNLEGEHIAYLFFICVMEMNSLHERK